MEMPARLKPVDMNDVARNDRGRRVNPHRDGYLPGSMAARPLQFTWQSYEAIFQE